MTDADTLRRQMATSTDPDRLEREALSLDNMTLRLPDPSQHSISFSVGAGIALTIKPDGKIERGPGLSDDEATAAFVDCLSRYCPTFLAELRQRTERAEAKAQEAKRHIETLTGFYMDNVLWTRAAEEARAFAQGVPKLTVDEMVAVVIDAELGGPIAAFTGVSG